ncbi:hypothetical protein MRX96_047132 [Rhipicephalus microplus]
MEAEYRPSHGCTTRSMGRCRFAARGEVDRRVFSLQSATRTTTRWGSYGVAEPGPTGTSASCGSLKIAE